MAFMGNPSARAVSLRLLFQPHNQTSAAPNLYVLLLAIHQTLGFDNRLAIVPANHVLMPCEMSVWPDGESPILWHSGSLLTAGSVI
jgi:hypothetical protein